MHDIWEVLEMYFGRWGFNGIHSFFYKLIFGTLVFIVAISLFGGIDGTFNNPKTQWKNWILILLLVLFCIGAVKDLMVGIGEEIEFRKIRKKVKDSESKKL